MSAYGALLRPQLITPKVRFLGQTGKHLLAMSSSQIDPKTTFSFVAPKGSNGWGHYDSRSDRAFTSSLRCRTISVVLRISGSLRETPMVDAIESNRALAAR